MIPIDGQTQTAAAFALARNEYATNELNALERIRLAIELTLNMNLTMAQQSFADRNGKGGNPDKKLIRG